MVEIELVKAKYAFIISMCGLVGIFIIILVLSYYTLRTPSSDIVAIVGTITGLIGTIVGALLGVQVGSTDKQTIQRELNKTQKLLNISLATLPKEEGLKILSNDKEI